MGTQIPCLQEKVLVAYHNDTSYYFDWQRQKTLRRIKVVHSTSPKVAQQKISQKYHTFIKNWLLCSSPPV